MIRIVASTNRKAVAALLSATRIRDRVTETKAAAIVDGVRKGGDRALRRYAEELDDLTGPMEVPRSEWETAARAVPAPVRRAIRDAARNIRRVSKAQVPKGWRVTVRPGVTVEQRVIPLARVGCYVPAGRYPLPSSLLMTAIPARSAGVPEVIVACPRPDATVFAAALEAGVDRLFRVGGAHAVAAMAYGTRTVPRVDKVVGPGNRWVSAAKSLVSADCSIDFYAGPTEILIVAGKTPASWVAADLIAQAEHDPDARAVCITTSSRAAEAIAREVALQTPAEGPAAASLWKHGGIIVAGSMTEAVALANEAASEHLVVETDEVAARMVNAGAIFVGPWAAQVAGDYAIGSNHVLPTAGAARFRGGLNAADFVKLVSVQRVSERGLRAIAGTITTLARAEGLDGHARSIEERVGSREPGTGNRKTSRPQDPKTPGPQDLKTPRPSRTQR
ncbi:MAG: histidinol dehydrogenase [Acidobacteria bacterium]|nr:histidinol dehydrogenase [Acidobacteriota bacterium]